MLNVNFENYRNSMVNDLKNLIKIKSVKQESQHGMPYGESLFDALRFVQERAASMNLDCVNLDGHVAYIDYGVGDEMLGILVHVDVVPEDEGWTMPAFEGIEKDDKIYGRGACDNKGPAISALYALHSLNEHGIQLNKKVRLIFGTDQETSWADIAYYKEHERMPDVAFCPDGVFPVINAEKGLVRLGISKKLSPTESEGIRILDIKAGTRPNVVPNSAYCIIDASFDTLSKSTSNYECPIGCKYSISKHENGHVEISVSGTSAHGAYPQNGKNALASLITHLGTLTLANGDIENAIKKLAEKINVQLHGEGLDLNVSDDISGILTFCMGVAYIENNTLIINVDIRFPIMYTEDHILNKLEEHLGRFFELKVIHSLPSHYIPENSLLVKQLSKAYEEITGYKAYCLSIGSATYARLFKNAVTFGALFPWRSNVEHSSDEYIFIDDMVMATEIFANAIVNICL